MPKPKPHTGRGGINMTGLNNQGLSPGGLGRPSNIKPRSRVVARGSGRISVQEQSTIRATWEGNIFTTKDLDF